MKRLHKYTTIARVSLINAFQYPGAVVGGVVFYVVILFVFFSLWRVIYRQQTVAGLTLPQMMWYLCASELVAYGCRTGVFGQMNEDVKTGAVAYQLGRPYHYVAYQFANALGGMMFGFALYASLGTALALIFVGPLPGFRAAVLPLLLVSFALGVTTNFFLQMGLGLTAFRLEENAAFYWIYSKLILMLGVFMPVDILPLGLQRVVKCLPFSYVAWVPARLFAGFSWELFAQIFPMQVLWTIVAVAFATAMYRFGARGIQANGG